VINICLPINYVSIKIKGPTFVCEIWTLCDLWKKGVKKWMSISLVWKVFERMKEKNLV
jgi:hypothetical protein